MIEIRHCVFVCSKVQVHSEIKDVFKHYLIETSTYSICSLPIKIVVIGIDVIIDIQNESDDGSYKTHVTQGIGTTCYSKTLQMFTFLFWRLVLEKRLVQKMRLEIPMILYSILSLT